MTDRHPDPVAEGFAQAGERIVQVVSLSAAAYQLAVSQRARALQARAAKDRAVQETMERRLRAAAAEARVRYAPANDRRWLGQAGLVQVAEAWGAAVRYAAEHPAARSALDRCEERLRALHPHAMGHFDRACAAGLGRYDAMMKAAPFFARNPRVHEEPWSPRPTLNPGTGTRWAFADHGPTREDFHAARRSTRAREIAERLSTEQPTQPAANDLRTLLNARTNLTHSEINNAVAATRPAPAERDPAAIAADAFPTDVKTALAKGTTPATRTGTRNANRPDARPAKERR
ncbi:hypothetical protein [Actinomadura atramentaria]|uniref:hypothetical protein n=1 Tax=Actinomadura atramentaria TaxID=1990 RepID=UPI00037D1925|nr:hypothetical protein [Actinomadura atramentaria]